MLARTVLPSSSSASAWAITALLCAACSTSPQATTPNGTGGARGAGGAGGGSSPVDAAVDASPGDVAPPGWRLVWSDEFEGPAGSAVDSSKWKFDLGNNSGW